MTSLRQDKWERAKKYVLAHPDQSKEEQSVGADVSVTTIANIRHVLVRDGLMQPSRKARQAGIAPPRLIDDLPRIGSEGTPNLPSGMLDHEALTALADMTELEGLSDDEVARRLQRQCLKFAFDPRLHADTRMSASQMWGKLKEMAKARSLGPGKPLAYQEGVERLADLHEACGPEMTLDAVKLAFEIRPNARSVPNVDAQAAPDAPAAPAAPGSDAPVPTDASAAGPESVG